MGLCRASREGKHPERNLEANTILVRFPSIEFRFKKDVEGQA